jgi:hypothetical protein
MRDGDAQAVFSKAHRGSISAHDGLHHDPSARWFK